MRLQTKEKLIETLEIIGITAAVVVTLAIAPGIVIFKTTVEKNTFNRCTGSDVTFWEAASTQLRVEQCEK